MYNAHLRLLLQNTTLHSFKDFDSTVSKFKVILSVDILRRT